MTGWMDGWMNGWLDGWIRLDGWMDRWIAGWPGRSAPRISKAVSVLVEAGCTRADV